MIHHCYSLIATTKAIVWTVITGVSPTCVVVREVYNLICLTWRDFSLTQGTWWFLRTAVVTVITVSLVTQCWHLIFQIRTLNPICRPISPVRVHFEINNLKSSTSCFGTLSYPWSRLTIDIFKWGSGMHWPLRQVDNQSCLLPALGYVASHRGVVGICRM